MPSPKPKQVSDESMARIRTAIQTLAGDSTAPRTKRELQRRTGLSHDLVARAFRQDDEHPERWQLRELFEGLARGPSRRRTPDQEKAARVQKQLDQRNAENALLRRQVDAAATIIMALSLRLGDIAENEDVVVPMKRARARNR